MSESCAAPFLSVLMALLFLCGSIRPLPAACLSGTAMQEAAEPSHEREEAATKQLRELLTAEYGKKANRVIDHYVRAQQAFYQERHQQALQEISNALALIETADLLAFKGAIYFGMGQYEEAALAFGRAFSLDKELPLPRVAGLHGWLTDNNLMP